MEQHDATARDEQPGVQPGMQFSLRSLFSIITVCAIVFGLFTMLGYGLIVVGLVMLSVAGIGYAVARFIELHPRLAAALALGGCLSFLSCTLWTAVVPTREGYSYQGACHANLRNIALALIMYEQDHGTLPPPYTVDADGNRLHSWRTLILPYLEETMLKSKIRMSEPWDSPHNSQFHDEIVRIYQCPGDFSTPTQTSYVAVTGPNTAWATNDAKDADSYPEGGSNTILVVEMDNTGIHWMEPRDLDIKRMNFQVNAVSGRCVSSNHPRGANVALVDASVKLLDDTVTPEELKAMLVVEEPDGVESVR